jgi:hypothetical protein
MPERVRYLGRLVLLSPFCGGRVVLATLPTGPSPARVRAEAERHPGCIVCGEWLDGQGQWHRDIEALCGKPCGPS